MDTIQIKDKTFTVSIAEADIKARVKHVAEQLNKDMAGKNPVFIAILNGSFIFAADLLREVDMKCEISFIKVASYEGTSSTGKMCELIGLNQDIKDRTVVIVEDIVDSGFTMKSILATLSKFQPKEVHICTLLVKPDNLQVDLNIEYRCLNIPNDFIVGYGLDYDGLGRNLPDIYTVVE
jgi:hypoxanthine phosphoribosyltransferase